MRGALVFSAAVVTFLGTPRAMADGEEGNVGYEVREQVAGALLPVHDYPVTGSCETGSGVAPASYFSAGASGRGSGFGAGLGGRIGYQRPSSPPVAPAWWGWRAGLGVDLDVLYAKVPIGNADMTGQLCARVKSDGSNLRYQLTPVLVTQLSAIVGGELGLGAPTPSGGWRGVVLGAAWAPAIGYLQPWATGGDLAASYLGVELSIDFVTLRSAPGPPDPGKRLSLTIVLPPQQRGPAFLTAGFGVVWY